tara:strand:- start:1835 stop:2101 length:267 start_codon:yes stop_codon:yes gene_type:complete
MKRLKITVEGRVQGVFFRDSTRNKATELGILGFVRNQPDGKVYIEAEGECTALERFSQWCQEGPKWARVAKVEIVECPPEGGTNFIIN